MKQVLCVVIIGMAISVTASQNFVARVLYSEASEICSDHERQCIASVIQNRVENPAFLNLSDMTSVVKQKSAFSCVNSAENKNWQKSAGFTQNTQNNAWLHSLKLAGGNFTVIPEIVYYHSKDISKPKSWDNKYFIAVKQFETNHFIFYSIKKR